MIFTAELLLNYQRCSRRAFLDAYGDVDQRDAPNDYLLKLLQDSRDNQRAILAGQTVHRPQYAAGDLAAGAGATLELMQQGVEQIYQGVLMAEGEQGMTLVSVPDLLVRHPGQSIFGDWLYVPTEIKLGKRPKLEYQIILAYHVQVLAQVQGAWAETGWLLLREKGAYGVDLWEMIPRMQTILSECIEMLRLPREPEVFIARSRCSLCHWFSHCYSIARDQQHLSLLPGVTPSRYTQLQALALTTVESLASVSPKQLEPLPGFGNETAQKLVRQAQSTLQNQAFLLPSPQHNGHAAPVSLLHALPTATVELYFDIEAEPNLDLVYLHGVLVVDRRTHTQTFHPLVAENPEGERQIWEAFLDLVWTYPEAPIFHFCPYEAQTVERLAQLYGTPSHRVRPLLNRFFDLHQWVTHSVTLPVESYALKPIARWLGFDWRNPAANGAQSIYWYAQWLATGDRDYLNAILDYNEDDCRATYYIKDWLVNFMETQVPRDSQLSNYQTG